MVILKHCVIIAGGDYAPIRPREDEFVIACDRGYEYARREGIVPGLLMGDFDSYSGPLPENIPVQRFKKEKDDTDTMLAIRWAIAHGFGSVRLCCALGGRLDHLYANIQSLAFAAKAGLEARAGDENTLIRVLAPGSHSLKKLDGWSLSLFAMGENCENVCISGSKYELSGGVLEHSFPLGVSNEFVTDVSLSFEGGLMLVICCR